MGDRIAGRIVGVDGCRGGWLAVACPLGQFDHAETAMFPTFAGLKDAFIDALAIAVDIPIGLPERVGVGGRVCDAAARAVLGLRQSAVFSVPARAAVYAPDYPAACEAALARSDPPRKVSKQCFNLFQKIREVDHAIDAVDQSRIFECHPEVAFWVLNGCQPLATPKKVKSKPHPEGLAARELLLRAAGFTPAFLSGFTPKAAIAGADDFLDACACLTGAARFATGQAHTFPPAPPRDARGLEIAIRA